MTEPGTERVAPETGALSVVVPKYALGRAVVLLDEVPRTNLAKNQEYAPPGTAAWVAKAVSVLNEILETAS